MHPEKKPQGRPSKAKSSARDELLLAARRCFAAKPYREVTTRMLANTAGVNAALIRYYFMNKEGLYRQMLSDVATEFQNTVAGFVSANPQNPVEAILRAHGALILKNPDIPKLIFRELVFNEGAGRSLVIENVAKPNKVFMMKLCAGLSSSGQFREDFNPAILILSVLSVSIMPHLLKEVFEQLEGQTLDETMLEQVIWQNAQMIQFGSLKEARNDDSSN